MNTLIQAAQDVVTICKMYRTSLPIDVLRGVKNLEQSIAQGQSMSPKSVSGTSERSCLTCRRTLGENHWWCVTGQAIEGAVCTHWEPKT